MDDTLKKKVINLEGLDTLVTKIKTYIASLIAVVKKLISLSVVPILATRIVITIDEDLEGDIYYECSENITSLDIENDGTTNYENIIHFTTDSAFEGLILSKDYKTIGDAEDLEILPGCEYELSIKNNIIVLAEIQTNTVS